MNYEMIQFNQKNVDYIKKNYQVKDNKKENQNFCKDLMEQTKKYQKALIYKEKLDEGVISIENIPDEYLDMIEERYLYEIEEIKRKN